MVSPLGYPPCDPTTAVTCTPLFSPLLTGRGREKAEQKTELHQNEAIGLRLENQEPGFGAEP